MNGAEAYNDAAIVRDFQERYIAGRASPPQKENDAPLRKTDADWDRKAFRRFRAIIYAYYRKYRRDFPWRRTEDPYHILVSEIMLQQTQVGRVAEKFVEFIRAFPTAEALADARLSSVLSVWQGMGYNRRARYLHELARSVVAEYAGRIPDRPDELVRLPGIGRATAASIAAFAFNRPVLFVETNIRAVFIHFFFPLRDHVDDREIMPLVEASLDKKEPRAWYSALMDYGAMLKRAYPNPSRRSAHHQKQSPFEGSRRQIRGLVLRALLENKGISVKRLSAIVGRPESAVISVVDELVAEGMIKKKGRVLNV